MAPLSWHLQLLMPTDQLLTLAPMLRSLPVALVFDHFARVAPSQCGQAAHTLVLDLLESGRAWVKLSGGYLVSATCSTEGTFTFGNYADGAYDDEVLELLDLSSRRHLLPAIVVPGSHHAPLTKTAATETGLLEGTPIVLGPMDVPATLMGGGGVAHGPQGLRNVGCSVLGSTGMHGWSTQGLGRIRPSATTSDKERP